MYRFLAAMWRSNDGAAAMEAECARSRLMNGEMRWMCRLDLNGLFLFEIPRDFGPFQSHVLPENRGAVIGRLFSAVGEDVSDVPTPITNVGIPQAERWFSTAGHALVEECWGAYVAFLTDPLSTKRYVVRDCSGHMPCYRTQVRGLEVFFSDVEDLRYVNAPEPTIDWTYVAAFLYQGHLQTRSTGLSGIVELLAGDRVVYDGGVYVQDVVWSPTRVCGNDIVQSYLEAKHKLYVTVRKCVMAWGAVHSSVLHLLSGGFDSAVVLGCLAAAPTRPVITCLNRYNDAPGEDERSFARLAASQVGVPLLERSLGAGISQIDERLLEAPRTTKPDIPSAFGWLELEFRNNLVRDCGAESILTGQGGDHLFFMGRGMSSAADFVADHGVAPGVFRSISDCAKINRTSWWTVARAVLVANRSRHSRTPTNLLSGSTAFLRQEMLPAELASFVSHPWTEEATSLPLGTQDKIRMLSRLTNRHRPIGGIECAQELHPLISQPLMELCLQVSSYIMVRGGRSRALARDTFGNDVPAQIIEREDKGGITSWHMTLIRKSTPFLRGLLLDGFLARERLIKRDVVQALFGPSRPIREHEYFPLLACIAAEAWACSWHNSWTCAQDTTLSAPSLRALSART